VASASDFVEPTEEGMIVEDDHADIVSVAVNEALPQESNLGRVLTTINDVLRSFNQEPIQHMDKANAKTLRKYPKYLTHFSLLSKQFKDYLFRETFLVQSLIFVQGLLNPINQAQKRCFEKVTPVEKEGLAKLQKKIHDMLSDDTVALGKRWFSISEVSHLPLSTNISALLTSCETRRCGPGGRRTSARLTTRSLHRLRSSRESAMPRPRGNG